MNPTHRSRHATAGSSRKILLLMLAILAVIIAAVLIFNPFRESTDSAPKRVLTQMRMLEAGLDAYHADHGHYPVNDDIANGGHVLYKALFGDLDGDREPDQTEDVHTYVFELAPPPLDSDGQPMGGNSMLTEIYPGEFHVVDPWGRTFFYMCFPKGSETAPEGGGLHNSDSYDLWSIGTDDATGALKDREAKWIKNW